MAWAPSRRRVRPDSEGAASSGTRPSWRRGWWCNGGVGSVVCGGGKAPLPVPGLDIAPPPYTPSSSVYGVVFNTRRWLRDEDDEDGDVTTVVMVIVIATMMTITMMLISDNDNGDDGDNGDNDKVMVTGVATFLPKVLLVFASNDNPVNTLRIKPLYYTHTLASGSTRSTIPLISSVCSGDDSFTQP